MDSAVAIVATLGIVGSGITAGIVFAFSNFIMSSLKHVPDAEGMRVMQTINEAVYNPLFMGGFLATTLLSVGGIVYGVLRSEEPWALSLIAAGVAYFFGVFLMTGLANVPLNNALKALDPESEAGAAEWKRYLMAWTRWNHLRTGMAILSLLLFSAALASAGMP